VYSVLFEQRYEFLGRYEKGEGDFLEYRVQLFIENRVQSTEYNSLAGWGDLMLKRTGWRSLLVYRERGPRMW
jgi:hypothetical protein